MLHIKKTNFYHKLKNFTKLKYFYLNSKPTFNGNAENLIHNNVCLYRAIPYPLLV